eukprot:1138804-Pelagomonas_calceolata.AAC.6
METWKAAMKEVSRMEGMACLLGGWQRNKSTSGLLRGWQRMEGASHLTVFHGGSPSLWVETSRTPEGGLGLDSQKYVDRGLPPDCADFVYVCMEGKEGAASMGEYFHMLEVRWVVGSSAQGHLQDSTQAPVHLLLTMQLVSIQGMQHYDVRAGTA